MVLRRLYSSIRFSWVYMGCCRSRSRSNACRCSELEYDDSLNNAITKNRDFRVNLLSSPCGVYFVSLLSNDRNNLLKRQPSYALQYKHGSRKLLFIHFSSSGDVHSNFNLTHTTRVGKILQGSPPWKLKISSCPGLRY